MWLDLSDCYTGLDHQQAPPAATAVTAVPLSQSRSPATHQSATPGKTKNASTAITPLFLWHHAPSEPPWNSKSATGEWQVSNCRSHIDGHTLLHLTGHPLSFGHPLETRYQLKRSPAFRFRGVRFAVPE